MFQSHDALIAGCGQSWPSQSGDRGSTSNPTVERRAIVFRSRNPRILAGSGSGKTRVVTEKVAHLESGVDPAAVLVLVFSDKADRN